MGSYNFRRLKGTSVLYVLLLNLLLFSYHQSALGNLANLVAGNEQNSSLVSQPWHLTVIIAVLSDVFPKLLYPFAGWLADAKLGRYKVMRYSMWMMWIGSVLLILTSILCYVLLSVDYVKDNDITTYATPVFVVVYIVNALGIAGYHVNLIPFGIEQMEGPSGEQIASFIHWYYWTRNFNFGVIVQLGIRMMAPSYCDNGQNTRDESQQRHDLIIFIIQMFFLSAAVSLDFLFSSKLFKDAKIHNPVKKVRKISSFIMKHSQPVGRRSPFTYTYDIQPSRSDFAKKSYGGPFEDDEVEDVTSFWRMALFLLSTGLGVFMIQTVSLSISLFFPLIVMVVCLNAGIL